MIDGEMAEALTHLKVAERLLGQDGAPEDERLGLHAEARRVVDRFEQVATEKTRAAPMLWTEVHLALGQREAAYHSASLAVDTLPYPMLEEMVPNAPNDPALEEPRYRLLRRRAEQRLSLRGD
jgi:hypothetical protein